MAGGYQLDQRMAADVAATAGDENLHEKVKVEVEVKIEVKKRSWFIVPSPWSLVHK